ncbi:MAG: hypothetical protein AB7L84_08340 [Acidimicrobiia bacterium]
MADDDQPPPPAIAPRRPFGCLFWAVALPLVLVVGFVGGSLASRTDDGDEERHVTLARGTEAGGWRVDAVRDVEGDVCTFIYVRGDQSTGSCDVTAQDDTLDDGKVTVLFGRAPQGATRVAVPVEPGEPVVLDTVEADGIEGRFYVTTLDADVDAAGVPEVLSG